MTIRHALLSYKLREYYHPLSHRVFYDESGNFDLTRIDNMLKRHNLNMEENFVFNYSESLKSYEEQYTDQVRGIYRAQETFKIALAAIPVFAFLMIVIKFMS